MSEWDEVQRAQTAQIVAAFATPSVILGPVVCERCDSPLGSDAEVCCSSHGKALCHACYRRTHFVEVCDCGQSECTS